MWPELTDEYRDAEEQYTTRRPAQSTKDSEGILAYLKKEHRQRFVGEWNVEEAL
jgi:hypothetical protein